LDKTEERRKESLKLHYLRDILPYSLYLSVGFFISQKSHIEVYKAGGATTLQTWFNLILGIHNPSVEFVEFLSLIMSFSVFFYCSVLPYILCSSTAEEILPEKILHIGILISIIFCTISQLIFSSIMRLIYEFSFCLIVFASIIIYRAFIQPTQGTLSQNQKWRIYQDLWELLKILTPICMGFPTLMGGVDLIYKGEPLLWIYPRHMLMVRHILMAGYFEVGAAFFLIIPILKMIFHMRRNL